MADVSIPAAIYTLVVVTLFILLYEKGETVMKVFERINNRKNKISNTATITTIKR